MRALALGIAICAAIALGVAGQASAVEHWNPDNGKSITTHHHGGGWGRQGGGGGGRGWGWGHGRGGCYYGGW